ncbi:N-acetyllactosaminide beta-1,3-N-acetylglucosaminyltransferase 2 isoform X1 [Lampetra planeri]
MAAVHAKTRTLLASGSRLLLACPLLPSGAPSDKQSFLHLAGERSRLPACRASEGRREGGVSETSDRVSHRHRRHRRPHGACAMNMMKKKALLWLVCAVIANLFVFFTMQLSRGFSSSTKKRGTPIIPASDVPFWRMDEPPKAYWNREQWRLERSYNPILVNGSQRGSVTAVSKHDANNSAPDVFSCEPNVRATTEVGDFETLPQSFRDFLLYQNCQTFPQLIDQPRKCAGHRPFLLFAIKSVIAHFDRRQAIRESWGAETSGNVTVRRVFLLGRPANPDLEPNLQHLLDLESKRYSDILQWDFRDSFFNLTLKELLFLKWVEQRCSDVRFIFKGDDDVFVNTDRTVALLSNITAPDKVQNLFLGDVIVNAGPHRDKKVKYYIPESVFEGAYPPYAGGGGYVYSGEMARRIHQVSRQVMQFPIDDVYVGMCLRRMGFAPTKNSGFRTFDISEKERNNICVYRDLILVHPRNPHEMMDIWKSLHSPNLKC